MIQKSAAELFRDYQNEPDDDMRAEIYKQYRQAVVRERVVRPLPDSDRQHVVARNDAAVG